MNEKAWSALNSTLRKMATFLCHDFPSFYFSHFLSLADLFVLFLLFIRSFYHLFSVRYSFVSLFVLAASRCLNPSMSKCWILEIFWTHFGFLFVSCLEFDNFLSLVFFSLHFNSLALSLALFLLSCVWRCERLCSGVWKGKRYKTMHANNFRQLGTIFDRTLFAQIL